MGIWPPDWSQFIPDLVNAVLVGAGIGYALWRLQVAGENRSRRVAAKQGWDRLQPRLRRLFNTAVEYTAGSVVIQVRDIYTPIVDELADDPLREWNDLLEQDKEYAEVEVRRVLVDLDNHASRLLGVLPALDREIGLAVAASQPPGLQFDRLGQLHGLAIELVRASALDLLAPANLETRAVDAESSAVVLEEWAARARQVPAVEQLVPVARGSFHRSWKLYDGVRLHLEEQDREPVTY